MKTISFLERFLLAIFRFRFSVGLLLGIFIGLICASVLHSFPTPEQVKRAQAEREQQARIAIHAIISGLQAYESTVLTNENQTNLPVHY